MNVTLSCSHLFVVGLFVPPKLKMGMKAFRVRTKNKKEQRTHINQQYLMPFRKLLHHIQKNIHQQEKLVSRNVYEND